MIKIYKYGEVDNSEVFARDNIDSGVAGVVSGVISEVINIALSLKKSFVFLLTSALTVFISHPPQALCPCKTKIHHPFFPL